MLRDAWKGEISTVEELGGRIVADVGKSATRLQLLRTGRRFLLSIVSVLVFAWFLARFGFWGLVLALAVGGGLYLWVLDRRWKEPGTWEG